MSYQLIFIVLAFLSLGCKSPIAIKFSNFEKYSPTEEHTSVILLRSFIINNKCDSAKGIFFANAFLCKTAVSGDTVIIYSICKPPYPFLKENYKDERDLIIDSSKIFRNYPEEVYVNIADSILKKKYKYIVADLIKLEY